MLPTNRNYALVAISGYLATIMAFAYFFELQGMTSLLHRFLILAALLAVPFALSALITIKLFKHDILLAETLLRAIRLGAYGGLSTVFLVAVFTGIAALIHSVWSDPVILTNMGGLAVMGFFLVVGAFIWAAIPAVIFGGAMGWCLYNDKMKSVPRHLNKPGTAK